MGVGAAATLSYTPAPFPHLFSFVFFEKLRKDCAQLPQVVRVGLGFVVFLPRPPGYLRLSSTFLFSSLSLRAGDQSEGKANALITGLDSQPHSLHSQPLVTR